MSSRNRTFCRGPLPGPLPLFPRNNWWNRVISTWPVDPASASYISFIGNTRQLHPDFGGNNGPVEIYGFPYIVVDSDVPKVAVEFEFWDESDGVNLPANDSYPFYPIPPEAATQAHWVEGGTTCGTTARNEGIRRSTH